MKAFVRDVSYSVSVKRWWLAWTIYMRSAALKAPSSMPPETDETHNQELSACLRMALVQDVFGCRVPSDTVLLSAGEEGEGRGVSKDNSKGDRPGLS